MTTTSEYVLVMPIVVELGARGFNLADYRVCQFSARSKKEATKRASVICDWVQSQITGRTRNRTFQYAAGAALTYTPPDALDGEVWATLPLSMNLETLEILEMMGVCARRVRQRRVWGETTPQNRNPPTRR